MHGREAKCATVASEALVDVLKKYKARLPVIMAGLADRPKAGQKLAAREALATHMREMQELALALGRIDPVAILGSSVHSSEGMNSR
jgi:hypothetical protein